MNRSRALLISWLATAVIFGLLHLPTYNWDFVQCVVIIGTARLVLSLAYIKTKNLWVSSGAHILNDTFLILINVLLSSLVQP
jgi:membrane protease YdiL (CAAX protease family)